MNKAFFMSQSKLRSLGLEQGKGGFYGTSRHNADFHCTYDMQLIHYSYFLSFLIIPKVFKMSELIPLPHL